MSEIVKDIRSFLFGESLSVRLFRFGIIISIVLYMALIEPFNLQVTENTFDLFDTNNGKVAVVLIGDLHDVYNHPDYFQRVIETVNAQNADIILIAGDNVNSGDETEKLEPIRNLKSKYGVYAVLGNHDYSGLNCGIGTECADKVEREMENFGIKVLRNEHLILNASGNEFALIGVDDAWAYRNDYSKASNGVPPQMPKIILTHNQLSAKGENLTGPTLVLSGHTHCGHVRLPFVTETLLRITGFAEFIGGRISLSEDDELYVTCGITPGGVRLFTSPEVSILYLE